MNDDIYDQKIREMVQRAEERKSMKNQDKPNRWWFIAFAGIIAFVLCVLISAAIVVIWQQK